MAQIKKGVYAVIHLQGTYIEIVRYFSTKKEAIDNAEESLENESLGSMIDNDYYSYVTDPKGNTIWDARERLGEFEEDDSPPLREGLFAFHRVYDESVPSGSSRKATLFVAPALMVRVFGEPDEGGDYIKVSGEFTFSDHDGENLYEIYDYKKTHLYSHELPSPAEFWSGQRPEEFSVGSKVDDVSEFMDWVVASLNEAAGGEAAKWEWLYGRRP